MVVYENDVRPHAPDDLADDRKDQAARARRTCDGVDGQGASARSRPQDGQVAQTLVTFNFGKNGWNKMPDAADELREHRRRSTACTVHIAGQGGQAADSAEAFAGIDGTLLFVDPASW